MPLESSCQGLSISAIKIDIFVYAPACVTRSSVLLNLPVLVDYWCRLRAVEYEEPAGRPSTVVGRWGYYDSTIDLTKLLYDSCITVQAITLKSRHHQPTITSQD